MNNIESYKNEENILEIIENDPKIREEIKSILYILKIIILILVFLIFHRTFQIGNFTDTTIHIWQIKQMNILN